MTLSKEEVKVLQDIFWNDIHHRGNFNKIYEIPTEFYTFGILYQAYFSVINNGFDENIFLRYDEIEDEVMRSWCKYFHDLYDKEKLNLIEYYFKKYLHEEDWYKCFEYTKDIVNKIYNGEIKENEDYDFYENKYFNPFIAINENGNFEQVLLDGFSFYDVEEKWELNIIEEVKHLDSYTKIIISIYKNDLDTFKQLINNENLDLDYDEVKDKIDLENNYTKNYLEDFNFIGYSLVHNSFLIVEEMINMANEGNEILKKDFGINGNYYIENCTSNEKIIKLIEKFNN